MRGITVGLPRVVTALRCDIRIVAVRCLGLVSAKPDSSLTGVPIGQYLIERECPVRGVVSSSAVTVLGAMRFTEHQRFDAGMR